MHQAVPDGEAQARVVHDCAGRASHLDAVEARGVFDVFGGEGDRLAVGEGSGDLGLPPRELAVLSLCLAPLTGCFIGGAACSEIDQGRCASTGANLAPFLFGSRTVRYSCAN